MALEQFEFNSKKALDDIRFLSRRIGARVSGSDNEAKAAEYIAKRFKEIDSRNTEIKTYPHKYYEGRGATLQKLSDGEIVEGNPVWMTKSTPGDGVEGNGVYLGSVNQIDEIPLDSIKDKIAFVFFLRDYLEPEVFGNLKKLYKLKPKGVVLLSNYNSATTRSDPIFEETSIFSEIPTILVSAAKFSDFDDFLFSQKFKLTIKGSSKEGLLHNVFLYQEGEVTDSILVCAHHDTVEYSQGALNNATGVAVVLELARIFCKVETKFSYIFASFGGEEQGLDGAKLFVEDHFKSDIILCLNMDAIEPFPGFIASIVAGNDSLFQIVKEESVAFVYPALAVNSTPNAGNNMVFAREGIPSIMHLFKGTIAQGISHTEFEVMKLVSADSLKLTGQFVLQLISKIESTEDLDFSSGIPANLEEETENYFERLQFYNEP